MHSLHLLLKPTTLNVPVSLSEDTDPHYFRRLAWLGIIQPASQPTKPPGQPIHRRTNLAYNARIQSKEFFPIALANIQRLVGESQASDTADKLIRPHSCCYYYENLEAWIDVITCRPYLVVQC